MQLVSLPRTAVTAVMALALSPAAVQAAPCAPSTDQLLPPAGYDGAEVLDFGPGGLIVGDAFHTGDEFSEAALWRDGVPEDLGLDGFVGDVNRRGDMVVTGSTTSTIIRADGSRVPLSGLGGSFVYARRISEAGHAAGSADDADGVEHPVVWRAPDYQPYVLRIPHGFEHAFLRGINDRGDTVGVAYGGAGFAAFKWHRRTGLKLPGGDGGQANVIDDRGRTAGVGVLDGIGLPAVWFGSAKVVHLMPAEFGGWFGTNGQGDWAGVYTAGELHALVGKNTGAPRMLVPLSGDLDAHATAHAVSLRHDGDVDVGGLSTARDGSLQATVWRCAHTQSVEPVAAPAGTAAHSAAPRAAPRIR